MAAGCRELYRRLLLRGCFGGGGTEDVRSLPVGGVYIWRVVKKILGRAVYRFAALEENRRIP